MRSEWEFCTLFLHFTFFYKAKFFGKNKELGERLSNIIEKRRNLKKSRKTGGKFYGKTLEMLLTQGADVKISIFRQKI